MEDDFEQLVGHWSTIEALHTQAANSPGSYARFRIHNCTSLWIALRNLPTERVRPSKLNSSHRGTISIVVLLNKTSHVFEGNAYGILKIPQELIRSETHDVTVELLRAPTENQDTLQFEGVWLSKGAVAHYPAANLQIVNYSQSTVHGEQSEPSQCRRDRLANIIQVIAPATSVSCTAADYTDGPLSICNNLYAKVLKRGSPFDLITTSFPLPPVLCITSECNRHHEQSKYQPTLSDLYFTSSVDNTDLFYRAWWRSSQPHPPSLLILDTGLTDFQYILSNSSQPPSQRALDNFMAEFVDAYVEFIMKIRGVSWHQTSHCSEPSYAYTSGPSTLPILIMTPVIPPRYSLLLNSLVHTALQRVVHNLQTIKGDQHSVLIDTSGWLDESDFVPDKVRSKKGNPDYEKSNHLTVNATPTPNAHGHIKLAHFLFEHLCPYLHPADDGNTCTFDHYDIYRGNLYDPTSDHLARLIEEKKIDKIKQIIGFGHNSELVSKHL